MYLSGAAAKAPLTWWKVISAKYSPLKSFIDDNKKYGNFDQFVLNKAWNMEIEYTYVFFAWLTSIN